MFDTDEDRICEDCCEEFHPTFAGQFACSDCLGYASVLDNDPEDLNFAY